MKKNKQFAFIFLILITLITAGFAIVQSKKTNVSSQKITAIVTDVIDKPNQAEDGYYGIEVKDKSGKKYTIDATGYLNTPLRPDDRDEVCAKVPKVKVGDSLEFNLPKSQYQQDTFDICYQKNLTGYYLKLG